MKKRSGLKIITYLLYIALIVLFFVFAKIRNRKNYENCESSSCVRFCSSHQDSAYINETSDDIELTHPLTNLTQKFHFFHGEPCEKMKLLDTDQWKFSSVRTNTREKNVVHQRE